MWSPVESKKVYSNIGWVTVLGRFVLRAIDKCFPFFLNIKRDKEHEQAFQALREHLRKAPLLAKLMNGENLFLSSSIWNSSKLHTCDVLRSAEVVGILFK